VWCQAHRFVLQQFGDGEAVVGLDELQVVERATGVGQAT
jgi:hypothetical protein